MQKFQDVVLDSQGRPVAGAVIAVQSYPSGDAATVYQTDAVGTAYTPTTDNYGAFYFYAPNGYYNYTVTVANVLRKTVTNVEIIDTIAALDALPVYATGTWDPNLTFVTPGTQTFVKDGSSFGTYTKIGNRVMCDMFLYYTTFTYSGTSGSAKITGLPFASDAATVSCGALSISGGSLSASVVGTFANMSPGTTDLIPYYYTQTGDGPMTTSQFPSGSSYIFIRASFVYKV